MPSYFFTFQFWSHAVFAALGSGLLYMQWGRTKLKAFFFGDLLDTLNLNDTLRHQLEIGVFVTVGTAIALGVAKPDTVAQAFSAGLGWTGLAARPGGSHARSSKGGV